MSEKRIAGAWRILLLVLGVLMLSQARAQAGLASLIPPNTWTAESDQQDAEFGYSADTAGDVNGDGYADLIVGPRRTIMARVTKGGLMSIMVRPTA